MVRPWFVMPPSASSYEPKNANEQRSVQWSCGCPKHDCLSIAPIPRSSSQRWAYEHMGVGTLGKAISHVGVVTGSPSLEGGLRTLQSAFSASGIQTRAVHGRTGRPILVRQWTYGLRLGLSVQGVGCCLIIESDSCSSCLVAMTEKECESTRSSLHRRKMSSSPVKRSSRQRRQERVHKGGVASNPLVEVPRLECRAA